MTIDYSRHTHHPLVQSKDILGEYDSMTASLLDVLVRYTCVLDQKDVNTIADAQKKLERLRLSTKMNTLDKAIL